MPSIAYIINQDPTTITITRHTKVQDRGGFTWTDTDLDPITVRLYNFYTRNQREATLPSGEVKNVAFGFLAEHDVDVVVGHDSYDTFLLDSRTYRVVGVRRYEALDIPMCLQADVAAV